MKSLLYAATLLTVTAPLLHASHGQNFLLLEDYDIPAPGHGQVTATFDWEVLDGPDTFASEPNFLLGLLPGTALGLTAHFDDENNANWHYSSITPRLYLRLPDTLKLPFKTGFSFGYQFADGHTDGAEEEEHGHDDHDHHAHGHAEEPEPAGAGSGHFLDGIDNHDANLWHTRLLIEADLTSQTKAVLNVIGVFPEGRGAAWGYGAGLRQQVLDTLSLGAEARGDFDSNGQHELLAAAYWSPVHDLTFRIGAGFGLTDVTPDFTLRTGVIWRF